MDPQELYNELKNICIAPPTDVKKNQPKEIDPDKMWTVLFSIAQTSIRTLGMYYPLLLGYIHKLPQFLEKSCQVVTNFIIEYSDNSKSFDERTKLCGPLALLAPLLSISNLVKFFDISVDIMHNYINENQDISLEFIDVFDEIMTEDLQPQAIAAVYNHLHKLMGTEKAPAAMFILAPISFPLLEVSEGADTFVIETVLQTIKKDRINQIVSCFLLEYLSVYFDSVHEAAPPAEVLANDLIPLLTQDDSKVRYRASRAFKSLIQEDLFLSPPIVTLFLSSFPNFTTDAQINVFFKIVSTFIYPEEEYDDYADDEPSQEVSILQPILDFAMMTLKSSQSPLVRGHCLDTLADLEGRDTMFVEDCYQEALRHAEQLVAEGHVVAFPWLSSYFVAMSKDFTAETKSTIIKYLPTLVKAIHDENAGRLKDRLNLAADLAVMVGDGFADDLCPEIANYAMKFLSSENIKEMMNACAIFIALRPKLTPKLANTIFEIAAKRAEEVMSSDALTTLVQTMRKIMKKFDIDDKLSGRFTQKIMEGQLAILYGQPPHLSKPPEKFLFLYLERYIVRNIKKASEICAKLIEWIAKSPFSVIPMILRPIDAGLQAGVVNEQMASILTGILSVLLPQLNANDIDELSATCRTLKNVYEQHPDVVEPCDPFFEHLSEIVSNISEEDDKSDDRNYYGDMKSPIVCLPDIAMFVFTVYTSSETTKVFPELLQNILKHMPFRPEIEENEELMECLCSMLEEEDRFKSIVVPALSIFTELLLLKKAELDEYELEEDTVTMMKDTLKRIVKTDSDVQKQLQKLFGSSRAKLNRFNTLTR